MVQTTLLKDEPTSEQLSKELTLLSNKVIEEQNMVAKEILRDQEEQKLKSIITSPSAIALSTTRHDAGEGVNNVKKNTKQLFILFLTNQFVNRAVNIRADTLVSKGFNIVGTDAIAVAACQELIKLSGGSNLFRQMALNTYIAGDGFHEKVYNVNMSKLVKLKHVHPLTLTFKKDENGRILLNTEKEPEGYIQYYIEPGPKGGIENVKDVNKDRISHLKFNSLGDEFTGISLLQSSYDTVVRLMNMEYSAAEASVKTANPLIVGKCNTKSPQQIAQWGTILGRINGRDQLFIPEGMSIEFMSPDRQNFSEYADYFLNAVVSGVGVPKSVLLGEGGGNRAEGIILTRHFYSSVRGDQKYMEDFYNEIFEEYAELSGFKEAPKLVFNDIAEDAHVTSDDAIKLFASALISREEARNMLGLEASPTEGTLPSLESQIKNSDMETWHPESPGKVAGSQKGEKKDMKSSAFSEFRGDGKPQAK